MKHFKHILFLSILCSLVLFTNCGEDSDDDSQIYRDQNGITIKATEDAIVGEYYLLNNENYLVVDIEMLVDMVLRKDDITRIVTTKVLNMVGLFDIMKTKRDLFNQDISSWDVSNVTNMAGMFWGCKTFNQDISSWDVSNVKNMFGMFDFAENFNQNLSLWDVSNVTECLLFSRFTYSWALPKPNFTNCTE